jgi:hypothetical protein
MVEGRRHDGEDDAKSRTSRSSRLGSVLGLFAYGFLPSWGDLLVRWVVIPGIAASGFAMWFAAPLRRLLRRARPSNAMTFVPDHLSGRT